MRTGTLLAAAAAILAGAGGAGAGDAASVHGEYLEARTCDVWTGPCFANADVNLRGQNAVAAWSVTRGSWDGVRLDGLGIAAVLDAEGTLHTEGEGAVRAALYVDERASAAQAKALAAMARALAPRHLARVVSVERRPFAYAREGLEARLTVGTELAVRTVGLCDDDAICCNEEQAYPAFSAGAAVACVKSAEHAYRGGSLGGLRWSDPNRRSGMVGTFAR